MIPAPGRGRQILVVQLVFGRIAGAHFRKFRAPDPDRITTLVFSMEEIWKAAAQRISSSRAMPASLPVKRYNSVIAAARAAARSAWARTRAARLPAITATNSSTPKDSQLLGSEMVKV